MPGELENITCSTNIHEQRKQISGKDYDDGATFARPEEDFWRVESPLVRDLASPLVNIKTANGKID